MSFRSIFLACIMLMAYQVHLKAQVRDSIVNLTGIVYDNNFYPVPACHVINMSTHQGDITDSLGIFRLPVHSTDTLLVRNIAFRDTLISVSQISDHGHIIIKRKYYELQEAKIFEWGSTYEDFRKAIIEMPNQQTLGESMGFPRQDPDYLPYDMNEEALKSAGFLLTSPVSYFYHNFNKKARSARKIYWLKRNEEKHKVFDEIVGSDNISSITGLTGTELLDFQAYLYQRMVCDFSCDEISVYTEIHGHWEVYQKLQSVKSEK